MLQILKANIEDVQKIHEISEELNIKNIKDIDNGVLLRILDEKTISDNIENIIVAKNENNIAGFLWYAKNCPSEMLKNTKMLQDIEGCIYSEQVAVRREYIRQGIGRKMYNYLKENSNVKGITVFVNIEPQGNKASLSFHKSLGFEVAGIFEMDEFVGIRGN